MPVLRCRWLLPIDRPPIEHGWIEIERDRIVGLGRGRPPSVGQDLGDVVLLPGLVNAHTHLELSWLSGKVPPADTMPDWVRGLLRERSSRADPHDEVIVEAAGRAMSEARATGTVLVGDVSNTLITMPLLERAGLEGVVFHELLGFNARDGAKRVGDAWARVDAMPKSEGVVASIVPHAPYSVSPDLFRAIAANRRAGPLSVHVGESQEEIEFLRSGTGPFRRILNDLRLWDGAWEPPQCDPVEYLDRLGCLTPGCLAVHGVHLSMSALERLRDRHAILVTCPRSNVWVGAGLPPVSHFYGSGVRVAIGTDSLASVSSLNLFDELAELRRIAPEVTAAKLLESATWIGAEALGRGADFGTLAVGKRAALTAVQVPEGVRDVEEYLVSGFEAGANCAVAIRTAAHFDA